MKRYWLSLPPQLCGVLVSAHLLGSMAPVVASAQGRIEGQITNGTNNRPVANLEVSLLQPRQGMQQVATASTDANGRFLIVQSEIDPSSFYLLQAEFQGVHYPAPIEFDPTNTANVNLTVFEATRSDLNLRIQSMRILVRAEGPKVRVQEQYIVQNPSAPPRAYYNPDCTFRFRLSPAASEPTVAVAGMMNMALPQTAERGKSAGEFFIRYPIKPGLTSVMVAYEADYASRRLALADRSFYPIDHAELYVSPSSLSVESTIFKRAGLDPANDVQKFEAAKSPSGAILEARISGEPAPGPPSEPGQATEEVKVDPNPMTRLGVPLLICFLLLLLWALGVRVAKEWPQWKERSGRSPAHKQLEAKVDEVFNSLADLDELFAARKIAENQYWKERLELKARLVAILKKGPPSLLESYASRHTAR